MAKNKHKAEPKTPLEQGAAPVIPVWLIAGVLAAWASAVLLKYFKVYPFSLDIVYQYFSGVYPQPFAPGSLLIVMGKNLASAAAAFLIFFAANGAGKLISASLALSAEDKFEKLVLDTGLGLAALMLVFTAVGMTGLFYIYVIGAILAALAAHNIYRIASDRSEPGYLFKRLSELPFYARALLGVCFFMGLLGSLTPETFYDAVSYHLSVPQYWINNHAVKGLFCYHSSYIAAYLHTVYAAALLLGNEISAKCVNLSFAVMAALAIIAIAKRHFSVRSGLTSLLLFVTVPVSIIVATRVGLEFPLTFVEIMALYSALRLIDKSNSGRDNAIWAAVTGVFLGISVASKYTSGGAVIGMFAGLTYYYISGRDFSKMAKTLPLLLAAILIIMSPWITRNYVTKGHPLFPFVFNEQYTGLNMLIRDRLQSANDMPSVAPGLMSKVRLPWDLTMGIVGQEGYIGPVFLLLLPLLFVFRRLDRRIKFLAVYFFLYYLFWMAGRPYLRYFLPAVAALSLVLGYAVNLLPQGYRKFVMAGIAALGFVNITLAMGVQKNIQDGFGVVFGMQSKYDYLSTQRPSHVTPYYNVATWINANLPKEAKLLIFCDPRGYYIKRDFVLNPPGDYCPLIEYASQSATAAEVYEKLKKDGFTHLLINSAELKRTASYEPVYWEAKGLEIFDAFWKKHVRLVHFDLSDLSLPGQGIFSMKLQHPEWWQRYSSDLRNYVYVYEIKDEQTAKAAPAPVNMLLMQDYYPEKRWNMLKATAERLMKI